MKTRSQKLISLVLVLMMLVTMIPAGLIVANAEVSAELSAGLADYANTTEFVINSVEDWEAVAASGKNFAGKTVKLGADIDANNAALPTLFATFAGTFDGQGNTIKNATVSGEGDVGLIATALTDGAGFSNVNFDTITVTSTGTGLVHAGVLGASYTGAADFTVQNVKATGITINHAGTGSAGGFVGNLALGVGSDGSKVYFTNIVFDGIINTATNNQGDGYMTGYGAGGLAGGVIATHTGWDDPVKFYAQNADVTVTINATKATATYAGLGGILGRFGSVSNAHLWEISNCLVNATITAGGPYAGTGAIVGYTCGGNDVITNTIANLTFETTTYQGVIGMKRNGANIAVTNLWSTTANMRALMKISGSETINGADADNFKATEVTASVMNMMVERDSNNFITRITTPDPLDLALNSYATATEFVINSASDWNKIAAYSAANSSTTWAGKTIVLGADIIGEVDENGAPTTTLNILSPTQFYGTFDGNNKMIKNVKGGSTLFTNKIDGTTFKNVTFDNVVLTATGNYCGIFTTIVNDWASSTFSNITVKNTTVTAKAADSGMLCGIVDNKGGTLTFSNITIEDSTLIGASHTGVLFGSLQTQKPDTSLVIDGIKMNNVTVKNTSNATLGGLIGWTRPNAEATATTSMVIRNVTMTNMTVSTGGDNYATGALIGRMNHLLYDTTIENVNVSGTVSHNSTTSSFAGGVFGKVETTGNVTLQNIASNVTLYAGNTGDDVKKGGFVGQAQVSTGKLVTMKNIYVRGSITDTTVGYASMGGFAGYLIGVAGENSYNISDIVVDVTLPAGNSMTLFAVQNGNVVLSNAYSTKPNNGAESSGVISRWEWNNINTSSFVNGAVDKSGVHTTIISEMAAAQMVKENLNGFVDGVYTTTVSAYQSSVVSNNKYAVRFIAFDFMGDATNVSMNVIAMFKDGTGRSFTADCTMYDALTAFRAQGITESYTPEAFDAKAIAGFTIYNIPTGAAIDFTATVTYTTADGTFSNVMYLSFDANGACTTAPMAN